MSGDTTILLAMLLIARCPHLLVFSLVGQSSCCNVSRGIPVLSLSYHPCTSLPPMLPLPILLLSINSSSRLKRANHRIISQRNGLVFFPSVSFCYTRNLDPCSHCVVPVSRDGGSSALCSPAPPLRLSAMVMDAQNTAVGAGKGEEAGFLPYPPLQGNTTGQINYLHHVSSSDMAQPLIEEEKATLWGG